MIQVYEIDENGYLIFGSEKLIVNTEELPQDYVATPLPCDEKGNQLPFYRPKWNGEKWIEGLSQEEIDELNNVIPEPAELEELANYLLDIDFRVVMLEVGL